jgi:hypothetical protein
MECMQADKSSKAGVLFCQIQVQRTHSWTRQVWLAVCSKPLYSKQHWIAPA